LRFGRICKNRRYAPVFHSLAEKEGFEPPEACTSTVFKTAAIDHSAISPLQKYDYFGFLKQLGQKNLSKPRTSLLLTPATTFQILPFC